MKYFIVVVPGLLAIIFGGSLLSMLMAWASLQNPSLKGLEYGQAVLTKLFTSKAALGTLFGVGLLVVGLVPIAWTVFFRGSDRHEREQAIPAFWTTVGLGTAAMLALLVCVNYFGLQAGEIKTISGWINR
jgi:ABC-type Fe3+ transport system permease subunit